MDTSIRPLPLAGVLLLPSLPLVCLGAALAVHAPLYCSVLYFLCVPLIAFGATDGKATYGG